MFKIPEESFIFTPPAEAKPAFSIPQEAEVFAQPEARGAAGTEPKAAAGPVDVPDEAAVFPDADKGDDQNWFLRKAITGIVGGVDWVANVVGSTVGGASADAAAADMNRRYAEKPDAFLRKPDEKLPSQKAAERREWIKGLVPDAWRATFQKEAGADIPDPWVQPVKFLDVALSQSLANSGNLLAAFSGKSPVGMFAAAATMADQEAAGYADTWAKQAGLPIDFVAGYAKQYGLLSAPVEYAQNMMFAGKGGLARGGKALALRKGLDVLKSKPMRALLAAADISLEGVTEVGQGLIENLVARSMVRDWNKANPQEQLPEPPAWSNEEAWQQFKGGAGMGLIYKVTGAAGGKLRRTASAMRGPATGPAQAGAFEPAAVDVPVDQDNTAVPVPPAQPVAPVATVQPPALPGEAVPAPAPAEGVAPVPALVPEPVAPPPAQPDPAKPKITVERIGETALVKPAAAVVGNARAEDPQRQFEAVTPQENVRVKGRYAVIDADVAVTSEDAGFDQSLQPRNRGTQASLEQIDAISKNPDPLRLKASPMTDTGAPMLLDNNMVLSGNGRVLGLRKAYQAGRAEAYRAAVLDEADRLGLDAAGMRAPVLVRVLEDSGGVSLQKLAELSNRPAGLQRTEAEIAEADGRQLLETDAMSLWRPDEEGGIRAASNREFLNRFVEATGDQSMRDSDGNFTEQAEKRVRRAVLAAVLGRGPNGRTLVRDAVEQAEPLGIKNHVNALLASGGDLLKVAREKPEYDLTGTLGDAYKDYMEYRKLLLDGKIKSLQDYVGQGDFFTQDARTEEVRYLLGKMYEFRTSAKKMRTFLDFYAKTALTEAEASLLGDKLTKQQVLERASNGPQGRLETIFGAGGEGAPNAADAGNGEGKQNAGRKGQAQAAPGNKGSNEGLMGDAVVAGEGGGSRPARAGAAYTPPSPMITMPGTDGPTLPGPVGGPRIDKIGPTMEPANDPTYSRLPMRLTAAVRMAKELGVEGVKLSRGRGNWRGLFKATPVPGGNPVMNILLRHNLFELVPALRKVEIRQASREQAKREAPNSVAAQREIEEAIYMIQVAQERAAALEKGAPEALKVMWHEIGHVADYLPDMTLRRGNLLGHIAALKGYMNRMIREANSQAELIPKDVRRAIDKEAQKLAGKRTEEGWQQRRTSEYKRLLAAEAKRRGLVTLDEVDQETRGLVAWWNGSTEMPGYYNVAVERYADVFSVLMNNPEAVRTRAPAFWNLWNGYLKDRPEVATVYDRMQEEILTGEDIEVGRKQTREKIKRTGPADWLARQNWLKMQGHTRWDAMNYYLFRNQGPVDWMIHKAELGWMKQQGKSMARRMLPGAPLLEAAAEAAGTAEARLALDNFRYASTWAETYNNDATMKVIKPLADKGISMVDFSEYMQYRHILEDRPDIASTEGIDPAEAKKRLDSMKRKNPALYADLEAAADRWFENRSRHVLALLERAQMLDPELMDTMRRREAYVAFMPVFEKVGEDDAQGLMQQMAKRYGDGVTAYIGFQKGWLGDIKDPVAATIQKDRKIIRAAYRNMAARELFKLLTQLQAQNPNGRPLIVEAPKIFADGKVRTKRIGDSHPDLGDLVFMDKGKLQHYYVPRYYASFMNGTHPEPFLKFVQAASVFVTQPFKRLVVDWAPGAWPWLAVKDFQAYATQTPGKNPIAKFKGIGQAVRDARSISTGAMTDAARLAMDRGMVMSRMDSLPGDSRTSATQREVDTFGRKLLLSEQAADQERLHVIREMGRAYVRFGNSLNRTWSNALKIKAMQEIDKAYPNMPEWQKRQIIRETAGNPDFLNRAAGAAMWDWGQLYYNAGKEGRMAAITALRMNPRDYLVNSLMWTAAPTILMGALQLGLVSKVLQKMRPQPDPDDEEDLKDVLEHEEMMKWIPSWEKSRNNVIPLKWIDKANKKVMYLRIPVSEGQLPAHGLLYGGLAGDLENGGPDLQAMLLGSNALDVQVGSPMWNIASAWLDYWRGRNPRDSYRGTDVLTDDEFKAGGSAAAGKMWKYTYNSFLSSLLGRMPYDDSPYAAERTATEKALQVPVVAGVLGKWVRVSGGFDEEAALIKAGVDKQDARSRLMVQRAVKQFIATGTWDDQFLKDVQADPYAGQYLPRYIKEWNLRNSVPAELKRFVNPGSARLKTEYIRRAQN
jgi:hypothetical protein